MTTGRDGGFPRTATLRATECKAIPFEFVFQSLGLTPIARIPCTGTASSFPRTYSLRPSASHLPDPKLQDFGGFPTPFAIVKSLMVKTFPKQSKSIGRTMTMPRANTIGGRGTTAPGGEAVQKEVSYISFSAVVGRNSRFRDLTDEQMDELGGVEYRALSALLYIVAGVSPHGMQD